MCGSLGFQISRSFSLGFLRCAILILARLLLPRSVNSPILRGLLPNWTLLLVGLLFVVFLLRLRIVKAGKKGEHESSS